MARPGPEDLWSWFDLVGRMVVDTVKPGFDRFGMKLPLEVLRPTNSLLTTKTHSFFFGREKLQLLERQET